MFFKPDLLVMKWLAQQSLPGHHTDYCLLYLEQYCIATLVLFSLIGCGLCVFFYRYLTICTEKNITHFIFISQFITECSDSYLNITCAHSWIILRIHITVSTICESYSYLFFCKVIVQVIWNRKLVTYIIMFCVCNTLSYDIW